MRESPDTAGEPLVTVVVPTWNRLALLKEAIASVIAQTYSRWELIVVDDGSSDGTRDYIERIGDGRIRVVPCPHGGNIGRLRNIGAAAGSGELIAFLDSDDLWLPRKLESQIRALAASPAGWCYTRYDLVDFEGKPAAMRAGEFRPISGSILRELLTSEASVAMPSLVVRRTLFQELGGFYEDPKSREDLDFYLRLAARSEAIALPELLVRVREHAGRTTTSFPDPHERSAVVYEKFLTRGPEPELALLARRVFAGHLADAGTERLSAGEIGRAARFFAHARRNGDSAGHLIRALARGVRNFGRSNHSR
jgi:glycosyltransferase involved in cell wall biosynthesis